MNSIEIVGINWSCITEESITKPNDISVAIKFETESQKIIKDMRYRYSDFQKQWILINDLVQYDWVIELEKLAEKIKIIF
jgi:hypothetical protein